MFSFGVTIISFAAAGISDLTLATLFPSCKRHFLSWETTRPSPSRAPDAGPIRICSKVGVAAAPAAYSCNPLALAGD